MRISILSLVFNLLFVLSIKAQENKKTSLKSMSFFNRSEISYTIGLNETLPNDKTNALHIKTILGFALPKAGLGFGVENGSFRSADGSTGTSFSTLAFSLNAHVLAKDITEEGVNFFMKGGFGYAPRIFRNSVKGLTYEGATGIIISTKRKSRYFIQGIYHHQNVDDLFITSGKVKVQSVGIGIGTWF